MINSISKVVIDITISMYSDTPKGKDPDTHSNQLNMYHQFLWSKTLPSGETLNLVSSGINPYFLHCQSKIVKFTLSSDGIIHPYSRWKRMKNIIQEINEEEIDNFIYKGSTIGAYIVFPSNKIDNKSTINVIRGMHPLIKDRFDFTLECIRRWYLGVPNPLSEHLNRYKTFFDLFLTFQGYVDYFLLNDLVSGDYSSVKFWVPFVDFGLTSPLPQNVSEYRTYKDNVIEFVNLRNQRIKIWSSFQIMVNNNYDKLKHIQDKFHELIIKRAKEFSCKDFLLQENKNLPNIIETITSVENKGWFPVLGMYGGFSYYLIEEDSEIRLITTNWSRIIDESEQRNVIDAKSMSD